MAKALKDAKKTTPPTNGPAVASDDDIIRFVQIDLEHENKISLVKAELKAAQADRKAHRKRGSAEGIRMEEVDYAIYLNKMEFQSEAVAKLADANRYAILLGLPVGTQGEMFGDETPDIEKDRAFWHQKGFKAAMTGTGAFAASPPAGCPTECAAAWSDGVMEAQTKIAMAMKPVEGPVQ